MILHIAGTGCPDPSADRFGSCFVLEGAGPLMMFDCGPAATYKLAQLGIHPTQIERLFFTHHHFDHNVDYPCFLLSRWDQGASQEPELKVYGPAPTEEFTRKLMGQDGAFAADWISRVKHPASKQLYENRGGQMPRPEPSYEVHDIESGHVQEIEDTAVTAHSVHHVEPWLQSLAYRVESPAGTVAFTGDAGPCPALQEVSQEADVLVVASGYRGKIQDAVADVITGATDAGKLAAASEVKTVVLTHTTAGVAPPGRREAAIAEVAQHFNGRTIFADEPMSVQVP
ncbi:MAG: MBL fold metallo-hydrolase [Candidatus Brocadiia bacterium]